MGKGISFLGTIKGFQWINFFPGKLPGVLYGTLTFLIVFVCNTYAQDQCQTGADCFCSACRVGICLVNSSTGFTVCSCMPEADGTGCDDGHFCNGTDTCLGGSCDVHSGDPCPSVTSCNETTDSCEQPPGTTTTTTSQPTTTSTTLQPITTTTIQELCPPDYPIDCGDGGCCPLSHPVCGRGIHYDSCFETGVNPYCPYLTLYGEDSYEVALLRYFRDNVLNKTQEGQELIKLYYLWGPVIVKAMEEDKEFKEDVKDLVDGILPMVEAVVE